MSSKVTYGEIIEALSRKTGFSKQKSEAFTKALINKVQQELEETGKSSITNFGSFKVKEVAERQGQNPQTGEPITIPAHKRVSFTPYKALRERVNAKYAHLESKVIEEEEESAEEKSAEEVEEISQEAADVRSPDDSSKDSGKRTIYADRRKGDNTGLIIFAVLMLVVIASLSFWYMLSSDEEQLASDEPLIEQPQTPEAAMQLVEEDIELEEEGAQQMNETESAEEESKFEEETEMSGSEVQDIIQPEESAQSPEMKSDLKDYTVNQDEWYWVIARKVYGKERFWPIIFMYNSSQGVHPDSLNKGVKLEIPPLEGTAENPTSRDLRRLAEASEVVAKAYRQNGSTEKANEYARFARKWAQMADQ